MNNFSNLLKKYNKTTIASSIWLLLGLWFMFGMTSQATDGWERTSGGDLIFQANDHLWTDNLLIFLFVFVLPVIITWVAIYIKTTKP